MSLPKAIFATLTPDSHTAILNKINPMYSKLYTHHVTMVYGPKDEDMKKLASFVKDGDYVTIALGRRMWANGVDAAEAKVFTLDGKEIPVKNAKPHVTISTENKPPVLSNDMLATTGDFSDGFEGVEMVGGEYEAKIEYVYKL